MKYLHVIMFILISYACTAQLHDKNWVLGYSNNQDTTDKFGAVIVSFIEGGLSIVQNPTIELNFNSSNSSYSDSMGILQSYSNAVHIGNKKGKIMQNGNFILNGEPLAGGVLNQAIMALPIPEQPNQHLYVYNKYDLLPGVGDCATKLYYALVSMSENAGQGKVLLKKKIIIDDTLSTGGVLTAVKHANGRDWWVLANKAYTNLYYRILITPSEIKVVGTQVVGDSIGVGAGQVAFSPDGNIFANYYSISTALGGGLEIYNFDRCTGLLSNQRSLVLPDASWGGIAFSPNSRFLYLNNTFDAYQFDMQNTDVFASRLHIATWDGYQSPFPAVFYLMQLAPDGKIYSATVTGCDVLHVIHKPNELGDACQYQQHAIHLPTYNAHSLPNFPYYRLGPLDGTSCDTLGIDNLPIAKFRFERDTLLPLQVFFSDLSYYEPTSWSWNFGDGTAISTEQSPIHTFSSAGNYEVCLQVSNGNATNQYCRKIYVGVSATDNPDLLSQIQVGPNPFRDNLFVSISTPLQGLELYLYDLYGHRVRTEPVTMGSIIVPCNDLPAGMYFWEIVYKGSTVVANGKVVALRK
jgi:uncharacterized membrane protein